jgi:hypothetical protein
VNLNRAGAVERGVSSSLRSRLSRSSGILLSLMGGRLLESFVLNRSPTDRRMFDYSLPFSHGFIP